MSTTKSETALGVVPVDTFGARLAIVRQHMRWNVLDAATACNLGDNNWRNWEHGVNPRRIHEIARAIANASGVDYTWLIAGGPLVEEGVTTRQRRLDMDLSYLIDGPAQLDLFSGGPALSPSDAATFDALAWQFSDRDRRHHDVPVPRDRRRVHPAQAA